MTGSLKTKTVHGLFWSGIERLLGQIITFVLTLMLARLVTPEDYGTLAIVMVFITLSGVIVDAGFSNALIRKIDCTDIDRSTVLFFNIAVSILIYGLLWIFTPLISMIYDNLELVLLIRTVSIVIVINSFSIVQQAILNSNIDFKKQTFITLISSIISGIVGIFLAYNNYGVWALVVQVIISYTIRTVMLWLVIKWRPLLVFSKESFKDLFGYSFKIMLSNMITLGGGQIILLLIGRFFSVTDLGYYNYAQKLGVFIPGNILNITQRVLFPVFSQIQNDEQKFVESFRKSLILTMTLIFPIMFGISALAEPIIKLLLNEMWYSTIPLFRVISITMVIWPLLYSNMNILWVKKRSDISLKLEIINIILRLGVVVIFFKSSILSICIALGIVECVNYTVYAVTIGKISQYGLIKQIKDLSTPFLASIISITIFYINSNLISFESNLLSVIVGFVVIITIYILLLFIMRGYTTKIILDIIKNRK